MLIVARVTTGVKRVFPWHLLFMRMVGVMARQAWYRWYDLIWQSISWPGDPGKIDVPATIEFESLLSWKHSDGEHCRNGIGCENIGGDESGSALFSHGEWVRFLDRRIFQSTAVPFLDDFPVKSHILMITTPFSISSRYSHSWHYMIQ